MDLGALITSSVGLTILGALVGIIWKNLNARIAAGFEQIKEIKLDLRDRYVSKELYQHEIDNLNCTNREIKDGMDKLNDNVQHMIKDVETIKAKLEELLKK